MEEDEVKKERKEIYQTQESEERIHAQQRDEREEQEIPQYRRFFNEIIKGLTEADEDKDKKICTEKHIKQINTICEAISCLRKDAQNEYNSRIKSAYEGKMTNFARSKREVSENNGESKVRP